MRLIQADGIYLDGNKYVKSLRLNPGQRYSVLITAKENPSEAYWIRATIHPFPNSNNGYNSSIQPNVAAILQYIDNDNIIPSIDSFNNDQFIINQSIIIGKIFADELDLIPMNLTKYQVPTNENVKTFIYNAQHGGVDPGGLYFNNEPFVHPTNLSLLSLLVFSNSMPFSWPGSLQFENNEIIDIIINNIDFSFHPFHLHGHDVWVLAQGNTNGGYFNQSTFTSIIYNKTNPIYRDTFTVSPFSYIVFRLKANNPGIWMMHCHNDWHLQIGMALIFIESSQLIKQFYFNHNLTNILPRRCFDPSHSYH
jgi:iron transport multicopper oxidase